MPRDASARGSTWTCTAYFCVPNTCTCATPVTVEIRCAITVCAYSSSVHMGIVSDVSAIRKMDASAGLTLRNDGGVLIVGGSCRMAREMADCTSCAAASMSRSSENCIVIWEAPTMLVDDMLSIPAISEYSFSSGNATAEAMVSGLAPGSDADTWIVGKSMLGSAETGSLR